MNIVSAAVVAAALGCAAATCAAVPLAYDEAISGDLASDTAAELSLDFGINTIKGTSSLYATPINGVWHIDIDSDPVVLKLPTGSSIVAATVATNFRDLSGNTSALEMSWDLKTFDGLQLAHACYSLKSTVTCPPSPSGGSILNGLPMHDGPFILVTAGGWQASNDALATGGAIDYTLSFTVAVPEPGAAAMMLAGLGLLAGAVRRRKAGSR